MSNYNLGDVLDDLARGLEPKPPKTEYNGNYKLFQGKLLESVDAFPDCLEKQHFLTVIDMLKKEGFDPFNYRITELPIEGVYYFDLAVEQLGVDYFSVYVDDTGKLTPQYTTLAFDENRCNTFPCKTIRESIDLHET